MKHRPAARLTLHPLLALAFLPVLLLELGYQPLVHIPGHFTQRRLLFLLYRTEGRRRGGRGGRRREGGEAETCCECLDAVQFKSIPEGDVMTSEEPQTDGGSPATLSLSSAS